MTKTFSAKLNDRVIKLLDHFCERYHLQKSSFLEDIIQEGIERHKKMMELAASLQRGLEQEQEGTLYTAHEVEQAVFGKKKAG